MKKVVIIGGGTGQSALLKGFKKVEDCELSTIVTVADDGGSTGRLRDGLHLPAMGDIRNVMLSLAEDETVMSEIMNYRFDSSANELANHNLGNILFSALALKRGSFIKGIDDLSKILNVRGHIYPSTLQYVTLMAKMKDGSVVEGEHHISEAGKQIEKVFYNDEVVGYPLAIKAIEDADYIIIGIGSLYTSIMPNIIIKDIKDALKKTKAKIIYYCNSMSEFGETTDYSVEDHVLALENEIGEKVIDAVVISNDVIPSEIIEAYASEKADVVKLREKQHHYKVVECPLLKFNNNVVRHDADKVKASFDLVIKEI